MTDWKSRCAHIEWRYRELEAANAELLAALERGIKWHDDGPCWCECRRKNAAEAGTKIHSLFCKAARAAIDRAKEMNK